MLWELNAAGYSVADLKAAFKAADLRELGVTAKALKACNAPCGELKAAGYTLAELKLAGFQLHELKHAGFKERVRVHATGRPRRPKRLARRRALSRASSERALRERAQDLLSIGYSAKQIKTG